MGALFTERGLCWLGFDSEGGDAPYAWARRWMKDGQPVDDGDRLADLGEQLTAYAEGRLRRFSVPLDLRGTPFQLLVWRAVAEIDYGQVRTYAQVAAAIGRPLAVRAVGAANGANPISILIPCHRLIGSDGALRGYGGGLDLKARLLALEGR